jgi:hypothetical protein
MSHPEIEFRGEIFCRWLGYSDLFKLTKNLDIAEHMCYYGIRTIVLKL